MAMRARSDGAAAPNRGRPGGIRRVFEDFKPMSEWQQDDESHTLIINLPGFMKEQIKVSTEGHNIIRVRGERLVAGNKWSRFQEDFQVPQNGEMNSIRAKFQGGSLNITVPKKKVEKPQQAIPPQPKIVDIPKQQPTPQKAQTDKLKPAEVGTSSSQSKDEKSLQPEKTNMLGRDGDQKQPTPQYEKSSEHQKTSGEHNKHIAAERSDDVTKKMVDKAAKKLEGIKELLDNQSAKKMELEKDGAPEKKSEEKESNGKQIIHSSAGLGMEKYKKAVKGFADLNEERQLLVNMGVAVLVIMALSAYVTYKFASAKDKN
ncbi:hypothetical protein BUALT_Bualt19G0056200 [Buddleja alternifolia]|uniref:SHSP domain-containing protein n=1 Tax=Buddleja alternifolia TaxID=168488 RepID=A0AAV6W1I7_9LAMI|nr:hypothetical protein BUALT_Bualt19G0056200 [Buddleja alternifolia]